MSAAAVKLSPSVKALIAAPHALGSAIAAPAAATSKALFDKIRSRGEAGGVSSDTWLCLSTAALVTVNSPQAVCQLFDYAAERDASLPARIRAAGVSGRIQRLHTAVLTRWCCPLGHARDWVEVHQLLWSEYCNLAPPVMHN